MNTKQLRQLIFESVAQTINEMKFDPKTLSDTTKFPSFEERIAWAGSNLRLLGSGSSRIAYVLDSKRVLKVAKNPKGIAQNEAEFEIATNPSINTMYAKIFQYDPKYKWLVSELVRELNYENEFEQLTGVNWKFFSIITSFSFGRSASRNWMDYINKTYGEMIDYYGFDDEEADDVIEAARYNKWFLTTMEALRHTSLLGGDLRALKHWGKTPDQRVVLLDYGFTKDVSSQFYQKR